MCSFVTSVENASVDDFGLDKSEELETGEFYALANEQGAAFGEGHAKSILLGEHSVVYGKPAIALPVTSLRTMAWIDRVEDSPVLFSMDGEVIDIDELPERFASIAAALRAGLRTFGIPERDLLVRLRSGIPPAAGLGGSAAVAHALIDAVRDLADGTLTERQRFDLVQEAERLAHGNPSGLDATVARASRPVYFKQGEFHPLKVAKKMWLVLGDTGVRGSTSLAVARVRGFVDSHRVHGQELLDHLGQLADGAVHNLAKGDFARLGHRMDSAQEALEELGVGHESITDLVTAARLAGAHGAKLTGAGCGGCVMALAESADHAELISHAMMGANAVATWTVEVDPS